LSGRTETGVAVAVRRRGSNLRAIAVDGKRPLFPTYIIGG